LSVAAASRWSLNFLRITSQPIPDLREQGLPAEVAAVIERAMAQGCLGSSGQRGGVRRRAP
jgi:hypothetical protein